MRNFQKLVAVIALSGLCFALPAPSDSGAPKKSTKHAVKKDPTAEQLKDLKQAIEQQQAATQQLQEQLKQTQQQLQQTQQQLSQAQATANAANAKVATVETNTNVQVQKVQSDLTDVKTALNTTEATVAKDEKKVDYLEHPSSIAYKGIRLTPGGFLEMTEYWRSHATLSDQATPFSGIPLGGFAGGSAAAPTSTESAYNPYLTEYGMTARDTRITLRADADAGTTKLTGYYEMDFFGTSPTANLSQTTSFTPRIRQGWGRAKFANGWTITAGQMWSLITLNRKGVDSDNSNLWIPNIIEAQYSLGYDWARFAEVRIGKQIGKNLAVAFALDNPAYLNSGATNTTGTVAGLASLGNGLLGNSLVSTCSISAPVAPATEGAVTCTNTPTYSTNLAPDMIVKLAYDDPKLGHYEVKAIGRFFRDRVTPTVTGTYPTAVITPGWNNTAMGGGIGAGAIIPVVPGKVDILAQGLWGKGVSRYEDSGQYDFLVRSTDHNLQPLKSFSVLAGVETHPNKKTELDLIFGDEYYYRDLYKLASGALAGYGAYTANNGACGYENAAVAVASGAGDACTGNNKNLWNVKLYGYYDMYKGPMGTLRYGAEIDYVERQTWSGANGIAPKGNEKTAFTTMRYIFP
jgi:DNA-binding protein YbaB